MPRKDVLGGLPSSKLAEMSALAASERERWLDETLVGCGVVVGGGGGGPKKVIQLAKWMVTPARWGVGALLW